jgi:hypothetical protein
MPWARFEAMICGNYSSCMAKKSLTEHFDSKKIGRSKGAMSRMESKEDVWSKWLMSEPVGNR